MSSLFKIVGDLGSSSVFISIYYIWMLPHDLLFLNVNFFSPLSPFWVIFVLTHAQFQLATLIQNISISFCMPTWLLLSKQMGREESQAQSLSLDRCLIKINKLGIILINSLFHLSPTQPFKYIGLHSNHSGKLSGIGCLFEVSNLKHGIAFGI